MSETVTDLVDAHASIYHHPLLGEDEKGPGEGEGEEEGNRREEEEKRETEGEEALLPFSVAVGTSQEKSTRRRGFTGLRRLMWPCLASSRDHDLSEDSCTTRSKGRRKSGNRVFGCCGGRVHRHRRREGDNMGGQKGKKTSASVVEQLLPTASISKVILTNETATRESSTSFVASAATSATSAACAAASIATQVATKSTAASVASASVAATQAAATGSVTSSATSSTAVSAASLIVSANSSRTESAAAETAAVSLGTSLTTSTILSTTMSTEKSLTQSATESAISSATALSTASRKPSCITVLAASTTLKDELPPKSIVRTFTVSLSTSVAVVSTMTGTIKGEEKSEETWNCDEAKKPVLAGTLEKRNSSEKMKCTVEEETKKDNEFNVLEEIHLENEQQVFKQRFTVENVDAKDESIDDSVKVDECLNRGQTKFQQQKQFEDNDLMLKEIDKKQRKGEFREKLNVDYEDKGLEMDERYQEKEIGNDNEDKGIYGDEEQVEEEFVNRQHCKKENLGVAKENKDGNTKGEDEVIENNVKGEDLIDDYVKGEDTLDNDYELNSENVNEERVVIDLTSTEKGAEFIKPHEISNDSKANVQESRDEVKNKIWDDTMRWERIQRGTESTDLQQEATYDDESKDNDHNSETGIIDDQSSFVVKENEDEVFVGAIDDSLRLEERGAVSKDEDKTENKSKEAIKSGEMDEPRRHDDNNNDGNRRSYKVKEEATKGSKKSMGSSVAEVPSLLYLAGTVLAAKIATATVKATAEKEERERIYTADRRSTVPGARTMRPFATRLDEGAAIPSMSGRRERQKTKGDKEMRRTDTSLDDVVSNFIVAIGAGTASLLFSTGGAFASLLTYVGEGVSTVLATLQEQPTGISSVSYPSIQDK